MALIIEQLRDQLCLLTNITDVIISVDKQFSANSTDVNSRVSRESVSPDSSSGCFEGWLG